MSLRRKLALSAGAIFILAALAGFVYFVSQGTFFTESGCWETQLHPETNSTFSSIQTYKETVREYANQHTNYTDQQVEQLLDEKKYRVVTRNGEDVVQTQNPDLVCKEQRTVQ